MTAALLSFAVLIGVVLGLLFGGLDRTKPTWWKVMTSALLVGLVVFGFGIPTGGTFQAGDLVRNAEGDRGSLPLVVHYSGNENTFIDGRGDAREIDLSGLPADEQEGLRSADEVVVNVSFDGEKVEATNVVWINPPATFPYLPALQERARNIFFHVPAAWIATMAWFVAAFYAYRYIRRKDIKDDIRASSTASVGLLFCLTATLSGSVWSRFDWGSYWNWDPRQVSIVVVLMIFGAYFVLRSALDSRENRARISSVYILLMALPVLFFIGVFPRLMESLHPNRLTLNPELSVMFPVASLALTLLYFWLANVSVRLRLLAAGRAEKRYASVSGLTDSNRPVKVAMTSENERLEG